MYGILTYIYLHLPQKSTIHVGEYTIPMDPSWEIFRIQDSYPSFQAPESNQKCGKSPDWNLLSMVVSGSPKRW